MVTRAVTGAVGGAVGGLTTVLMILFVFSASCGFKPCGGMDGADWAFALLPVMLSGGLAGTALLHVWLLKLRGQPRPWSVFVPGVLLVIALFAVHGPAGGIAALVLSTTAFALAGVITGFGPWREILRKLARRPAE